MNKVRICVVVLVICLVAVALAAPMAGAGKRCHDRHDPGVIPPCAKAGGMTYGEWGAAWWQWALRYPKDNNPLNDDTGTKAGVGQRGCMWFLAGTTNTTPSPDNPTVYIGKVDRHCTIPAGKMLFFPVVNIECSTAEGNGTNEEELRASCDYYVQHTKDLAATIDGRPVRHLYEYRAVSPMFKLWWPADSVLPMPVISEPTNAVADGYWLMLAPLHRGRHVLHWEGNMTFTEAADGFDGVFAQDITYHLRVK